MTAKPGFSTHKQRTIKSFQGHLEGRESPGHPLEIFLEISNVCNLKCAMCSVFSELNPYRLFALKSEERGFLDPKHIEALEPLLSHALLVHCYGYGEPTVHPEFVGLLDSILQYEVLVDFFTNGMNLGEELCQFLVDRKIFRVTVSFSGASQEDYENVYLGGGFDTVLDGLARLHRVKTERGSRYPEIEINSIAFQHHMDRIVDFVALMADRGVNTIYLKPMHAYETLPMLHAHGAVMRPQVEGKLLEEAHRLARRRGLALVDEFSNVATAATPEEEAAVRGRLLWGKGDGGVATVPIAELKQTAKTVKALVPPKAERARPATAMDQAGATIGKFLDIRAPDPATGFQCSQPFKTFYVNQQGAVRPCCFGFSNAYLGHLDAHDGETIWNGIGFSKTRAAIRQGQYPMKICAACLKQKSYPKIDSFWSTVSAYAGWFKARFGEAFPAMADYAQLYIDSGEGFSEAESIIHGVADTQGVQTLEFKLGTRPAPRNLRLDPMNGPTALAIHKITALGPDGREHPVRFLPLNMTEARAGQMVFACQDPQIALAGFPAEGCHSLVVALSYAPETLEQVLAQRQGSAYCAQLFIDTGTGYSEADSMIQPLIPSLGRQDIEFELGERAGIQAFRFDPINTAARMLIHEAEAIDHTGKPHPLAVTLSNFSGQRDGVLLFETDDPQIHLEAAPDRHYRKLRFSISYQLLASVSSVV